MAAKQDADQALLKIAQELQGKLKASLRRFARDQAECEDLLQRTYERLLSTRMDRVVHSPEHYIHRTARNVGIDHLRQQKPEAYVPLDSLTEEELADDRLSPFDLVALEQQRAILRAIMERLAPRCREVFRLNREEGIEQREIARRLGITLSTVKNHLSRAAIIFAREIEGLNAEGVDENAP